MKQVSLLDFSIFYWKFYCKNCWWHGTSKNLWALFVEKKEISFINAIDRIKSFQLLWIHFEAFVIFFAWIRSSWQFFLLHANPPFLFQHFSSGRSNLCDQLSLNFRPTTVTNFYERVKFSEIQTTLTLNPKSLVGVPAFHSFSPNNFWII